jgi:hypothetical protein
VVAILLLAVSSLSSVKRSQRRAQSLGGDPQRQDAASRYSDVVPNPDAVALIESAVDLTRSHPSARPFDVLDLVMKGRQEQTLNFIEIGVRSASLADPGSDLGQVVARAFETAMDLAEWSALASPTADPILRDACLNGWRDEAVGRVCARHGVLVERRP